MRALCGLSCPALLLSPRRLAPPLVTNRGRTARLSSGLPRGSKLQRGSWGSALLEPQGRRQVLVVTMAAAAPAPAPIEVFVKAAVGHPDKLGDCELGSPLRSPLLGFFPN
jgi:hypothetical protein